mmetsp:Transcript_133543/g.231093  ORF Transcript_133543/g.231093 Transcript_133543/m.231093 type:complete len:153 (-) Transcript_133543:181-639(-)
MAKGKFKDMGFTMLHSYITRCFCSLPPSYKSNVGLYLEKKGVMPIASFCSGTDSPVNMMRAFCLAANDVFKIQTSVNHRFSTEIEVPKQKFLLDMFGDDMQLLLGDCKYLPETEPVVNLKTGEKETLPQADYAFGGFPCDDVSRKNNKRKEW